VAATPPAAHDLLVRLPREDGSGDLAEAAAVRDALGTLASGRLDSALEEDLDLDALAAVGGLVCARLAEAGEDERPWRDAAWAWLDVVRRSIVLRHIARAGEADAWMERILRVMDASRYTVGRLFRQRVETYGPHTLFRIPGKSGDTGHTWLEVGTRVDELGAGLLSLSADHGDAPIAVLSENRYEMALVDLACLTTGIVNVMIPATATEEDVIFILQHSKAGVLVASTESQLRKLDRRRPEVPALGAVVLLDRPSPSRDVLSLGDVVARGRKVPPARVEERREAVAMDGLATVMYTSGTTGKPKGIRFSQRNMVSKRFARALAVPEIGEEDVFLAYLPLFHTFGRFLELMGCVFWGATYVFLDNPSLDVLTRTLVRIRPTVFISVPKKWIELWEEVGRRVDMEDGTDHELAEAVRDVVGDRLRWGLSAAGYLDPEVFRFFPKHGVDLCSGFGMTEATGGITMTPPGAYRDDTLGVALPGIEVRLEDDGEMAVRGPYVMLGYHDSPEGTGLDADGWLHTGDLMERDEAGHFRLVDRKKEIYKNIKGESIAPQRVENLFRDFEAVRHVFLVGDHKPYNTLLIVANPDVEEVELESMNRQERRDYFRSLVVSVNRFLAPYERIVDFTLLDRDFDPDQGELTPKGTYRRKVVARNFAPVIDTMYHRASLKSPGMGAEIHVPNWLFQALGLTAGDVRLSGDQLTLTSSGALLTVKSLSRDEDGETLRIGSYRYRTSRRVVDLGVLLATPALWLGNEELVLAAPLDQAARTRWGTAPRGVALLGRVEPYRPGPRLVRQLAQAAETPPPALDDLDLAVRMLGSDREEHGQLALRVIHHGLRGEGGALSDTALLALRFAAGSPCVSVRRRGFQMLFPLERDQETAGTLERFLLGPDLLLDDATIALVCEESLSRSKIDALVRCAQTVAGDAGDADGPLRATARSLLLLLGEYGAAHPGRFEELRSALARIQVFTASEALRGEAGKALRRLTEGFRSWLGPVQRIAVDPEDGTEYHWDDVVTFDEGTPVEDKDRILGALSRTSLLREAVFQFSGEALLRLADIPVGGIWVSLLGTKHGKSVYRVTAHTRLQGAFDLALNLNQSKSADEVAEEIRLLLVTGGAHERGPLAEKFGGYWDAYDLWSEEFISGETLDRAVQRLARVKERDLADRLRLLWPFFVWSAAGAFVEFWLRTGRTHVLAQPGPSDVIVPTHDYQTGARIISIADRKPAPLVGEILNGLWIHLVTPVEERTPSLEGMATPDLVLAAFIEAVGESEGLTLLERCAGMKGVVTGRIPAYVAEVREKGFIPRRLWSAIDRYHRWAALAPDAPPSACAQTVHELFETYRLVDLLREYPGCHIRFFRETVFRDSPPDLARGLDDILGAVRRRELDGDAVVDRLTALRSHIEPGSADEYFLARLTYPHLQPGDEAGFLSTDLGGTRQTDIVVSLEDTEGRLYRIRQPVSPKEVGRLHRLFLTAKLDVHFRPENQFLVAISERGTIIGGIFYEVDEAHRTAHLEKIVVAERYRKAGVGDGLMNEFCNRLRAAGVEAVTTGFFRPSYFYRFGFTVGKRQAGLVKTL
jgi:long-subunit acyl-CoA synthetase (AMP-forming)/ribosomal protein S18 acetylase RimI-like enzyme